jgi:hypothetical protein
VAEVGYQPFGGRREYRLIVRRVEPTPGSQLALHGLNYSYFAFITDREGEAVGAEGRPPAPRRGRERHPRPQVRSRPQPPALGQVRRQRRLAGLQRHRPQPLLLADAAGRDLKTLRRRLFSVPGRLVRSARHNHLKLPAEWP